MKLKYALVNVYIDKADINNTIVVVEDMLRLNKNDNMGMRHYAYVMY
jgi:hypothetical protein